MSKKGQASVFIVIGIVVVVIVILLLLTFKNTIPSLSGINTNEIKQTFEGCLTEKMNYAIVSNNFIAQPSTVLARQYLETYMKEASKECSSVFSDFKDLTIIKDQSSISCKVKFTGDNFKEGDFNSIQKISLNVYYPVTVTKLSKQSKITDFSAEVSL